MSDARDFWQQVYERFDPEQPARSWRVDRPYSPVPELLRALDRPFGDKRFLILGTVGAGKSTELLRLFDARKEDEIVVLLDLHRHFAEGVGDVAALDHVQPWEVALLVGLAVYRMAAERLGHRWPTAVGDRLAEAIQALEDDESRREARLDVPQLASALALQTAIPLTLVAPGAGAAATALAAASKAMRWELPIGLRSRSAPSDQDERVQRLLHTVNDIIGEVQATYNRPLLLLVDGLDRVSEVATTQRLFVDSTLLANLASRATVMTSSVLLRRKSLAARVRGFSVEVLHNAPVLLQADPEQHGTGVDLLAEVYRHRVADLDAEGSSLPKDQLARLAYRSGGRLREFILLVRKVAERMWDADTWTASGSAVDHAVDQRRRVLELGLHTGHIALLRAVRDHERHDLPDDRDVGELLDRFWLLPYPNDSEWYYPHPLLTLRRV